MTTNANHELEQDDPRYLYLLLLSLVFLLLVVPVFEKGVLGRGLMQAGLTAVLITAAVASRRRRAVFYAVLFVVAVAAPLGWSAEYLGYPKLVIASYLLKAAFFVSMAGLILVAVIRRYMTSFHSIFGAVCSYLLLGLAWSMLYLGLLEIDENTFKGFSGLAANQEVTKLSEMIYFSFVTMSTLGYGDITPQTSVARTLSWMQSVTGQFYIAVLVAWMVTEIPRRRREDGLE